jgi:hypothetical protein
MRMLLFIPGFLMSVFLTLSAPADAAPHRGGFIAHRGSMGFRTGPGIGRNLAFRSAFGLNQNRRSFRRGHRVFVQGLVWPAYWYLDSYPNDYSYLDNGPGDYQYWDNSSPATQPESSRAPDEHRPIIIIVKAGNSWPVDSNPNPASINTGSNATAEPGQRRTVGQEWNEQIRLRTDPGTVVPSALPQPPQTPVKETQTKPPGSAGVFGNLVLVSWLEEAGKDVIYVQNVATNDIQKITSEPNLDNFRIVELHRNADPKLFEAVISNGNQQGPVRFRF